MDRLASLSFGVGDASVQHNRRQPKHVECDRWNDRGEDGGEEFGRQMAGSDLISSHGNHQALNQVLQLTYIARPGMLLKDCKGIIFKPLDGQSVDRQRAP